MVVCGTGKFEVRFLPNKAILERGLAARSASGRFMVHSLLLGNRKGPLLTFVAQLAWQKHVKKSPAAATRHLLTTPASVAEK